MHVTSRLVPAAAALAAVALLAACGGGGSTPTAAPATPEPAASVAPASVAPVAAAADPGKLCVMLTAKVEGLDVMNPALVGEMGPILKLVVAKPFCKTGEGGKKIADAPIVFKAMKAGAVGQVRAHLSAPGEITVEVLAADGTTVEATHVVTVGEAAVAGAILEAAVSFGATATEDGDPVLTVAPAA